MNISTGGPHILLFERDQQLAALLNSELQLAGYECHIARTAVEVFDAIARFPVRIVLVNLAQAAASRREFWVALDTQRRGSGIQVFTFHCSNLAGYGPRDPDDYSQASMADMEIDGMLGLMKLVDAVRARVPGAEGNGGTTVPRIPRTPTQSPSSRQDVEMMQRPTVLPMGVQQPAHPALHISDNITGPARARMAAQSVPQPPMNTTSTAAMPTPREAQETSQAYPTTSPGTQLPGGSQATYSDKIRAVLYPNPHSPNPHAWGLSGNNSWNTSYAEPDTTRPYTPQSPPNPDPASSSGISMLQRLANGQMYSSPGLAELSRLVQGHQPSAREENSSFAHESWGTEGMRSSPNMPTQAAAPVPPMGIAREVTYTPPDRQSIQLNDHLPLPPNPAQAETSVTPLSRGRDYQARPVQTETTASSLQDRDYQLRTAPIQDLPLQRSASSQSGTGYGMATKSSEGVSRAKETLQRSIQQQSAPQPLQPQVPTQPPLASMTTSPPYPAGLNATPSAPDRGVESGQAVSREKDTAPLPTDPPYYREDSEPRRPDRSQDPPYYREDSEPRRPDRPQDSRNLREDSESRRTDRPQDSRNLRENSESRRADRPQDSRNLRGNSESRRADRPQDSRNLREDSESRRADRPQDSRNLRENSESRRADRPEMTLYQDLQSKEIDESTEARNAVILDILQSLPALVTPLGQQEQALQPQVLNGRATRSLGNVLLDGHLVPQDRLEVAQNIQRMLRGVDMNYQLGEILLMFKLLTPDQLLAASLVGYGLITRTQISALGRIRQELHAIGLEYDLENLVILFRILTPEQLREARSSVLG